MLSQSAPPPAAAAMQLWFEFSKTTDGRRQLIENGIYIEASRLLCDAVQSGDAGDASTLLRVLRNACVAGREACEGLLRADAHATAVDLLRSPPEGMRAPRVQHAANPCQISVGTHPHPHPLSPSRRTAAATADRVQGRMATHRGRRWRCSPRSS